MWHVVNIVIRRLMFFPIPPRELLSSVISNVLVCCQTLLVRRGGGGAISLGIPVEYGVTALRIYIEGAVEHAVLYPPSDGKYLSHSMKCTKGKYVVYQLEVEYRLHGTKQ